MMETSTPAQSGQVQTNSTAQSGQVQTNITAQTGGNVCAPQLHGNYFQGPVYMFQGAETKDSTCCAAQDRRSADITALSEDLIIQYKQKHKCLLMKKCKKINEGLSEHGCSNLLYEIYTELYITQGGSGEVNNEHEVRQIETASRRPAIEDTPIDCNNLFKPLTEQDEPVRTVLTRGIAGIGKTVSVQKFILDWAEGRANQDVCFIFPLPFRELNLMKQKNLSLMELLFCFFPQIKEIQLIDSDAYKVIFIFDGLDECRLPLDFHNNESLWDVMESTSVDVLLTNLIKGNLLPSALLWITSRPAAANQIPPDCVDLVTEVRGFSDPQKEEYFRKRIRDQILANKIISHIKSSRSLYIMCHIPVFCWVSATVLERMLGEAESGEIPKTLTQMFTHFLIFQIKHRDRKYHGRYDFNPDQTRKIILILGQLAFEQLEKGNLIFYEEDLRECGIDVREVSVYSGVCTQIFREEFGLHLGKVFSFVHLSVQEFLAALFVFLSFINKTVTKKGPTDLSDLINKPTMYDFLKSAVDKALQSENGHLDLFLRFLLGLSLESNQTLLRGILTQRGNGSQCKLKLVEYIKKKIGEDLSPEKAVELLHCLKELNDHSLVQEVLKYVNRTSYFSLRGAHLPPAKWSAVAYVMLGSDEDLDEFDLHKYMPTEDCLLRLLPVLKASRKAKLCNCWLSEESCTILSSALRSSLSRLRELDMSDNKLPDSAVKLLSAGLMNPNCKLQTLRMSDCSITEEGYAALCAALKKNPSHLRELNLNWNKPGDSGVKQLSDLLEDPHCKLEKLLLSGCSIREEGCADLCSALEKNPSHLRELNLNYNEPGDSGVKQLSDLLENQHCKLEKLQMSDCSIPEEGCAALCLALKKNPSHLRELNLNYNEPGDSGVKQLSDLLEDTHCKLEKLQLSGCSIREEGYAALCSALEKNTSHLRELNLNWNKPGDSGVKQLSALLEDPHCKLEKLQVCVTSHLRQFSVSGSRDMRVKQLSALLEDPHCKLQKLTLKSCNLTVEICTVLASALSSNSVSLSELDLSSSDLQDSGVELLSAGLENPHCKLEGLSLSGCSIGEEGCAALCSALKKNSSSHLRELNLGGTHLGDSGVKQLSSLLKNPNCKIEKLNFSHCKLSEESCSHLASVLSSNFSSLAELDLSFSGLQDSGVKLLSAGLETPHCKLEGLSLSGCSIGEEGCAALCSALKKNPSSHLRELNLGDNVLGDSGVKQLSDILEDPHFKLEKLHLSGCSITEEGCAALCSALKKNPSHLRELDLNDNKPGDSGVKQLSPLLEDPQCRLENLALGSCGLTERSCEILASALSSTSSSLRELALTVNYLQDAGVKKLSAGLQNPRCKLERLWLCFCHFGEDGCAALCSALRRNPSHLRELNLTDNTFGDAGVKQLSALLMDPQCKLEKLQMMNCRIGEEGCAALAAALRTNPSHLRELNLDYNEPGDSGVKQLSDLLGEPQDHAWHRNYSSAECSSCVLLRK